MLKCETDFPKVFFFKCWYWYSDAKRPFPPKKNPCFTSFLSQNLLYKVSFCCVATSEHQPWHAANIHYYCSTWNAWFIGIWCSWKKPQASFCLLLATSECLKERSWKFGEKWNGLHFCLVEHNFRWKVAVRMFPDKYKNKFAPPNNRRHWKRKKRADSCICSPC